VFKRLFDISGLALSLQYGLESATMRRNRWNSYTKPHRWKRSTLGYNTIHRWDLRLIITAAILILLLAAVGNFFLP
jgi:hypothetical protein